MFSRLPFIFPLFCSFIIPFAPLLQFPPFAFTLSLYLLISFHIICISSFANFYFLRLSILSSLPSLLSSFSSPHSLTPLLFPSLQSLPFSLFPSSSSCSFSFFLNQSSQLPFNITSSSFSSSFSSSSSSYSSSSSDTRD